MKDSAVYFRRLDKQEKIEGVTEDSKLVREVFKLIDTHSEFLPLIKVEWHKYGPHSYQIEPFYYPSELLKNLIKIKP